MTGKMYDSSEDAKSAFQSKDLLNKIIILNEDNPALSDLDACYELYKLFWMANYLMWERFSYIYIEEFESDVPDRIRNSRYLSFRVNVFTSPFDTLVWLVETNAPQQSVISIIDLLAQTQHNIVLKYKARHGNTALDRLSQIAAGTLNRHKPLFLNTLEGEWLSPDTKGAYWPWDFSHYHLYDEFPTKLDINKPFYTLTFQKGDKCILGGSSEWAPKVSGRYDSRYNVISIGDTDDVIAFVVSLKKDILTVVFRFWFDSDSKQLYKREDDNLLIMEYKRKTDLMKDLRPGIDYWAES